MAIEHADSFDIYGTDISFMLDGVYAEFVTGFGGGLKPDPDGISTQRCILHNGGLQPNGLRYALQTPVDKIGISKRIWVPALPAAADRECVPFQFCTIDNELICSVAVQSNGALALRIGDSQVASYSTNVPVITAEAWWHLECYLDASADTLELRVEGQTVLDEDDFVLAFNEVYQVRAGCEVAMTGHVTPFYEKDFVIWNTLGTDNVDFLGPVRVMNLTPNADEALGGWTPVGDAEGYPILSNNPPLNGEYLLGAPTAVGDPMTYELTNLPDDITSVKAAVTYVRARKIDGGYGQLQTSMLGTDGDASPGADRPITAGYVYWRDVHERDPGTDAPWTRVSINDSQVQIDRTL